MTAAKFVKKHWGHELWIADGVNTPYALKRILFKAGNRTSLQVHQYKHETNYVLSGTGLLFKSKEKFDTEKFLQMGMTVEEVSNYENTFDIIELTPGVIFNISPGYVHRVVAKTDLEFIEASTTELDDVIRLQDDQGRTHGRIQYEHTKHTVVIPTAGLGSRLNDLSKKLNKSLLPYKNKPVIAHIIDNFPKDTRFIIPVGYKAEQVIDFCKLAYSDRNIEFVLIDDYTSQNSGPGYTVKKCLELINEPFWYIPCDTYFDEDITIRTYDSDTVFVKTIPSDLSNLYTMFKLIDDKIIDMTFKVSQNNDWHAFTGVMYIHDHVDFSKRLVNQNSPEIIYAIKKETKTQHLNSWLDFGSLAIYNEACKNSQKYDFTKTDEFTYICNNKVIKWWADSSISKKKYDKAMSNSKVIPSNCQFKGEWLAYDYFKGTTLYENYNLDILNKLLLWLDKEVWTHKNINISNESKSFYKEKTLARINKFLEKYPNIEHAKTINGIPVDNWENYLHAINWDLLENVNLPGFMHGDLQFDNLINDNNEFKIIDWRHEFAGLVEIGDIYYDLAKLVGGFIVNYSKIKQNDFTFVNDQGNITLSIPHIENYREYVDTVKKFVESKGWNYHKVKLLIPIIFWNMAPLHTEPFDKFLWYLGIMLFEENRREKIL